jgi:ubiquinone/menaquinone biosynthesis C-methylase UbiE
MVKLIEEVVKMNKTTEIKSIYQYSINPQTFNQWLSYKIPVVDNVRVLELGSNSGVVWNDLKNRFINSKVTICDDNQRRLDFAKSNLLNYNFDFVKSEFHNLPFEDGELDVVVSNHNLYRSKDLRKVLEEVQRVLRSGGIFIATTNSKKHLQELSDLMTPFGIAGYFERGLINTFDFENGEHRLEDYFEVVSSEIFENVLNVNDIASILSYLKSLDDSQINLLLKVRRLEIINFINKIIQAQGAFKITARPGVFICLRK